MCTELQLITLHFNILALNGINIKNGGGIRSSDILNVYRKKNQ